jgi:hypothetical protein
MQVLRRGSSGLQVKFLQRLLNKAESQAGISGTTLAEDGGFGTFTENALHKFQLRTPWLAADKTVGPQTWKALGLQKAVEHNWVRMVPQTPVKAGTCWSAAASMIKGPLSVGSQGVPTDDDGMSADPDSLRTFAQGLGWDYLEYTPTLNTLINLVSRTPIWLAVAFKYSGRFAPDAWGHVVVPSAVYTDGDPSGDGTLFRMHDPYPRGKGRIFGTFANPICLLGALDNPIGIENLHEIRILAPR